MMDTNTDSTIIPYCNSSRISLWQGDVTTLSVDAIVIATNIAASDQRELGTAVITESFGLYPKYVIHAVAPIWDGSDTEERSKLLAFCYWRALALAQKHGLKSIAFCCIGTTCVSGFPKELAARIALLMVRKWLDMHPDARIHVIFNVFTDIQYQLYHHYLYQIFANACYELPESQSAKLNQLLRFCESE